MKHKRIISMIAAAALLLCACGSDPANSQSADDTALPEPTPPASEETGTGTPGEEGLITFTDDLGREVTIAANPQKVVPMIGSFADIWCLAGGHDSIIATADDAWTSFDLDLGEDVLNLGGVKAPVLEVLLSAQPDFVIGSCNTAANLEMEDILVQAGIPVAYFDVASFEDYLNMLNICTQITGQTENYTLYGKNVITEVENAIDRQDGSAPTVLYVRASGSSCKAKGSDGNVLGEMLAALGCVNIADHDDSLLDNLSLEAIIAADPEYIFVVLQGSDPAKPMATLEKSLLSNPAWANLTAVKEGRLYYMEHRLYNLKPNAQWGYAYEKLADILYPAQ